jgi:outer membrane protein assembly factor BamB
MAKITVDAGQVLRDIKSGMEDTDLMGKYNLSAKGLQSLFRKLLEAKLLSESELDSRAPLRENTVVVDFVQFPVVTLKWRFVSQDVMGSPILDSGVVYCGSWDGHLYAIAADRGTELWRFKTGGSVSAAAALSHGLICFGSGDGYLYCLETKTGREIWRFKTGGPIFSPPTIEDGVVFVGSDDHHVYAVSLATGIEEWKYHAQGPVHSAISVGKGVVFFGSDDKSLYALDTGEGSGFSIKARSL